VATEQVLVVGLGNPGATYAATRHNVGAMVADAIAARVGGRFKAHKSGADIIESHFAGSRMVLAKPRTYMNLSGGPVAALAKFFKIAPGSLIVVHDDIDLPYGTIRVKQDGGEGGHNGLRSITAALGTRDYLRVRFGVGRPPGRMDPADFVLRDFSAAERADLGVGLEDAADAAELLISEGLLATQNRLH
jgi:PTH1 family peptidyl-tRNA hydrolase